MDVILAQGARVDETELAKEAHRSIDGGEAEPRVLSLGETIDLAGVEMGMFVNDAQEKDPFRGDALSRVPQNFDGLGRFHVSSPGVIRHHLHSSTHDVPRVKRDASVRALDWSNEHPPGDAAPEGDPASMHFDQERAAEDTGLGHRDDVAGMDPHVCQTPLQAPAATDLDHTRSVASLQSVERHLDHLSFQLRVRGRQIIANDSQ